MSKSTLRERWHAWRPVMKLWNGALWATLKGSHRKANRLMRQAEPLAKQYAEKYS